MAEFKVDVREETCPVPLIETRNAMSKAEQSAVMEVVGTHPSSKKEIPMAVKALRLNLLSVEGSATAWTIRIRR